ncbi:hypothetical protein DUNSADRAFT_1619 [Dunaliella salina]|uniref:Encoded protein n=1 Tax=Dunaliella salina TaxID=3046 RepID=A0ABQ7H8L2_DUNSA|nr:hypothetical protein DUNSADRAFT_1619 [Dunaliella salina]|eukprot:KAF5843192.1 hypothetical protein DUNSADRAFT_1619 [Dunaliella salina]
MAAESVSETVVLSASSVPLRCSDTSTVFLGESSGMNACRKVNINIQKDSRYFCTKWQVHCAAEKKSAP